MQLMEKRVSDYVPHQAYSIRPPTEEGWALAAVGYVAAIAVYLVALMIVEIANWSSPIDDQIQGMFGRDFLVIAPATLTAITLATRRGVPTSAEGRWRVDAALTGACALLAFVAVGAALGFLASFGDFADSFSGGLASLLIRAAAIVVCAVGMAWGLSELSAMRKAPIELPDQR